MKTVGFCTHFTQTDDWAFDFALNLAKKNQWQLNICHWLNSPHSLRRDMVYPSLSEQGTPQPISPALLTQLELELRLCYEPLLDDFTQVAFKLCEGIYQVELVRCLRQHLLDLVVMGYQHSAELDFTNERPILDFASELKFPMIVVGPNRADEFWLNQAAYPFLTEYHLPEGNWQLIEHVRQ